MPGSYAVVIGAGGLGHLAVQFLKALSPATVICVDQRESALEVVAGLGADHTVVAGPSAAEEIRGIMGGRGAEMVLDICGYDDTLALAAAVVGSLGRLTIVGVGGGTLPVNFFTFPYECSVQSTYWGSITELGELLALARTGDFRVHASTYALDQAGDVYRSMVGGTLQGRAVIVPNAVLTPVCGSDAPTAEPVAVLHAPARWIHRSSSADRPFAVRLRRPASSPGARRRAAAGRRHPGRPRR